LTVRAVAVPVADGGVADEIERGKRGILWLGKIELRRGGRIGVLG
jgi:hypothetical protein